MDRHKNRVCFELEPEIYGRAKDDFGGIGPQQL